MKQLLVIPALLATITTARADIRIWNATPADVAVDVTSPNGAVKTLALAAATDAMDDEQYGFSPGIETLKIAIKNDQGDATGSGTMGRNDVQVIVPTAKGTKLVFGGIHAGSNAPRATTFMNVTGDQLAIDLEGANGLGAHRGIAPSPELDFKKLTSLDAREASFNVLLQVKGATVKLESKVSPGYAYLIWKNRANAYKLVQLGNVPAPKKK